MYLYNSATHKKEELKTHTPNHVEMYTCGPTVFTLPTSAICAATSWRMCWRSTSASQATASTAS